MVISGNWWKITYIQLKSLNNNGVRIYKLWNKPSKYNVPMSRNIDNEKNQNLHL